MSSLGQPSGIPAKSLLALGLCFFLAALFLYTRHANFPSYYHADEPSKVDQLVHEYRNFKHPPLMLNMTEGVADLLRTPRDAESLVQIGRFLSAVYAAATVALLAVLAAFLRNFFTGIIAGILCLGLAPLYEAAHYFKEDTLFLFLGTLTTVLIVFYRSSSLGTPSLRGGIAWPSILGACLGLLVCSRYFTALFIPLIFWGLGFQRNRRSTLSFLGALFLVVILVHLPSLHWLPFFAEELPRETHYLVAGHYGVGLPVPHAQYLKYWIWETNPGLWALLAISLLLLAREKNRGPWIAVALFLIYLLTLSCLPKYSERYFLPIFLGTLFFSAWGADWLARVSQKRTTGVLVKVSLFSLIVFYSTSNLVKMDSAFSLDSRASLAAWIQKTLPPGSRLAQDDLVHLEALAGPPYPCVSAEFVPDLGTIQDLQKKGIRYVAICRRIHYPYTASGLQATASNTEEFARRHHFYLSVLHQGKILWEAPDLNPKILHPGITLIDIGSIPPP